MKIIQCYITENDCYKANERMDDERYRVFRENGPRGLLLHSVGCNQPHANVFVESWNRPDKAVCVHAFIDGYDGNCYQILPWNYRGWHAGGDANNTHIGIEMCEHESLHYTGGMNFTCADPAAAREMATRMYNAAVELFAYLCRKFELDPLADGVIISHTEGHTRGVASGHGDPEHLWERLQMDYTMDAFRTAVWERMADKSDIDI